MIMESNRALLAGLICVLTLILPSPSVADKNSGICPPSYPRRVVHNSTGECYEIQSQGPCGPMAVVASDPMNPNYGICRCIDREFPNCFGRPILLHGDRCYYEFSQGACKKGQWLVRNKFGKSQCKKTSCPIMENENDLYSSEFPYTNFYFKIVGNKTCFKTGSQGFCESEKIVYYLGSNPTPQCLASEPSNCNDITETPNPLSDSNSTQGSIPFGVPYGGI